MVINRMKSSRNVVRQKSSGKPIENGNVGTTVVGGWIVRQ